MTLNDNSKVVCRHVWTFAITFAALIFSERIGFGQASQALTPPMAIGSPYTPYGYGPPTPYGPAPVAIGPAPTPLRYGVPYPLGSPYPPPNYAVSPRFRGRQPSPFDPAISSKPPIGTFPPVPLTPIQPIPESEAARVNRSIEELRADTIPLPLGNLRVSVGEAFVNRIVARNEQTPGEVRDFILGARVSGYQTTETRLRIDILPSTDKIRAALILDGLTQSQTTGVTPQAMVDVASKQQFMAVKEFYFDGISFSTRHAVVHVRANNQTLGAKTPLSGTLFGGIADRIAYREAERRKSEAEAIARDKVAERVYPEFDSQIDKQLAAANEQLESTIRKGLRAAGFMPIQQQTFSTDTYLQYSAQVAEAPPVSTADLLEATVNRDDGVKLFVHETFLNAVAGRANLKGLKTTDKELKAILAPYEVKPPDGEPTAEASIAMPALDNIITDVEFDAEDPFTIRVEQDSVSVTIRAKFKPAGQDLLPPLAIKIDYKAELVGEKILVTPTNVRVKVARHDDEDDTPNLALSVLSQAIKASISKLAFDRALPTNLWTYGGACPRVTGIRSRDGWAAISID